MNAFSKLVFWRYFIPKRCNVCFIHLGSIETFFIYNKSTLFFNCDFNILVLIGLFIKTGFYDLCMFRQGFEHTTFRVRGERSNRLCHRRGSPTREYFTQTANFDLCLALMAIEQWGFVTVPYLLWQETSVYNCHQ